LRGYQSNDFALFLLVRQRYRHKNENYLNMRNPYGCMKARYEYVILVDGKEFWHGLNPQTKFEELNRKYPKKEVALAWRTKADVLVC
jgi:hypothetical protein